MKALKDRLIDLLTKAKPRQVLDQLLELDYIPENLREDIILLQTRFEQFERDGIIKGILNNEDRIREQNKINDALLILIEKLPNDTELICLKRENLGKELGIKSEEVLKITVELERRYTERLRQKLDWRLALSLELSYTQEGTSEEYVETFFEEESKTSDTIASTCVEVLQSHKHVLILGNPGAGKTTLLLELALEWLRKGEALSLPVIFNLASWTLEHDSLREWLENSLITGYGFSKSFAQILLDKHLILPLLDGLDEVGKKEDTHTNQQKTRSNCLKHIDKYICEENLPQFVICSRREEYLEIVQDAPIRAEILVNPITTEQINSELEKAIQKEDLSKMDYNVVKKLQRIIKEEKSDLAKVLCTPFYFNLAFDLELLYHSSTNLSEFPTEETAIKSYFLNTFINKKLENVNFGQTKSVIHLTWLAKWLKNRNIITFELNDIQPRDLTNPRRMSLFIGLVNGCICGVVLGVVYAVHFAAEVGGLMIGILVALSFGLIFSLLESDKIKTEDILYFKWNNLISPLAWLSIFNITLKRVISFSLAFAFIYGLHHGIYYDLLGNKFDSNYDIAVIYGLRHGLFNGIVIGSVFGLVQGISRACSIVSYFETVKSPYHRLKSGLYLKVIQIIVITVLSLIILIMLPYTYVHNRFYSAVRIGLIISPFVLYNTPIIRHFILRYGLFMERKIPLYFVKFLNEATEVRILEKDGGQWRFRHQIIQDYFANIELLDSKKSDGSKDELLS